MAFSSMATPGFGMDADAVLRNTEEWERRGRNWKCFDRIQLTEKQVNGILDRLFESDHFSSNRLMNPSIPEFIAILQEPGKLENTYVCYRKSLLRETDFLDDPPEGIERIITPVIDAHVFANNNGTLCNFVATIVTCELKVDGKSVMSTGQFVSYRHNDPMTAEMLMDQEHLQVFMRTMKAIYLAVQMMSLERPEIFVAKTEKVIQSETVRKKGRYKKVNKTKLIKVIRVSDEALRAIEPHGHRIITCPCWGVAGHWRTYKTGKRVWISPYRKGKQRSNPAAYTPKVYQLPKEEAAYV